MASAIAFFSLFFILIALNYNFSVTGYQQFSELAESFLKGKLFFLEKYRSWHDQVLVNGQYYWPLGPLPALIILPLVYIFSLYGLGFNQGYLNFLLVLGVFFLVFKIASRLGYKREDRLFWSFAFCFSSVFLGVALWPTSWFFAQTVTVFILLIAILEYLGKKRYWLIGLLFGYIALTRLTAFLGIFFFVLEVVLSKEKLRQKLKSLTQLILPVTPFVLLLGLYNYLRFGSFWEQGYGLQTISGVLSPQREFGLFSLSHLAGNLYYFLLAGPTPVFAEGTKVLISPFLKADPWGMGIIFTSPYILYMFTLKYKDFISKILWATVLLVALPILFYYGVGWYQFGYRYSLDFFPFLFFLFMSAYKIKNKSISTSLKILILITSFTNFYFFRSIFQL